MYASYEDASFWPFLSAPTQGIRVDFVRAQHSSYAWSLADLDRLRVYGHRVHLLPNAGAGYSHTHAQLRPCMTQAGVGAAEQPSGSVLPVQCTAVKADQAWHVALLV